MLRTSATAKKKRVLGGRKGNASFIHHIFSFLHDVPKGECAVTYPPVASSVPFKSVVLVSSELRCQGFLIFLLCMLMFLHKCCRLRGLDTFNFKRPAVYLKIMDNSSASK